MRSCKEGLTNWLLGGFLNCSTLSKVWKVKSSELGCPVGVDGPASDDAEEEPEDIPGGDDMAATTAFSPESVPTMNLVVLLKAQATE